MRKYYHTHISCAIVVLKFKKCRSPLGSAPFNYLNEADYIHNKDKIIIAGKINLSRNNQPSR